MRGAILIGLVYIGDALRTNELQAGMSSFVSILAAVFIVMDTMEWIKKLRD